MTRRTLYSLLAVLLLLIGGLWHAATIAAQTASTPLFVPLRTIGQSHPGGIRYDPNFDRFAWVDSQGQLLVVNAATLETLHVIYSSGTYQSYSFSHKGRLLAVAIDVRIDVWDVDSGTLVASFAPDGARRVQGPLQFTLNDELLVFDSIIPAPQALRRSENDTVIQPWVWDIAAARDQRTSVLVDRVAAYPFYNIRVSMIAGDNGILVGGLDHRIQIFDADTPTMKLIADLPADRLETDPIQAWRSATDPYLYVALDNSGQVVQVNTVTDETHSFQLGSDLDLNGLDRLKQSAFSRALQRIGDGTTAINPLAQLLLGTDYAARQNYTPPLFDLLDVLVPLTDDPQKDPATNTALLTYTFDEAHNIGTIDLLHPSGINQIALSPNAQQIAVREQSGQVDLYDIASGALQRIFTPGEPDQDGRRTFAYTDDGHTLVIDFARFDPATGQQITRAANYTAPFDSYTFSAQNQLITFGGTVVRPEKGSPLTWRLWDVETGHLLREGSFVVSGNILAVSDDKLRYLTQSANSDGSAELTIIDGRADSTQTVTLPLLNDTTISTVIPNADWTRFLVVYSSGSEDSTNTPIAVYDLGGQRLYFDAGNNLPAQPLGYQWVDNQTIALQVSPGSSIPAPPILGLSYHPSGLPQCVVDALPNTWQSLVPVWESVVYNNPSIQVDALAQQLCIDLIGSGAHNVNATEGTPAAPANPTAVVNLLTPTPPTDYRSARTPAPIAIPGVPACITTYYRREAIAYADLWRQITANVTDPQQLAQLNTMICEGLLTDLSGIQPTPTVNPNALVVATPTPLPAAPVTTGGDANAFSVMTIDIRTGVRAFAANVVPTPEIPRPDTVALLTTFFRDQYKIFPVDPVISPDGHYLATHTKDGYVTIYQLTLPLPSLLQDEQNAIAARVTQAPRSLGLVPTSSPLPQVLGAPLPTLTPTVSVTPIPFTQNDTPLTQWGQSQQICPAPRLTHIAQPPDGFAPPGTLIVTPLNAAASNAFLWTLNPRTGKLVGNAHQPQCGVNETCTVSPDGKWVVRQEIADDGNPGDVIVSLVDGSNATTLYTAPEVTLINPSFEWTEPHILDIRYSGVLPTVAPEQIPLVTTYNPDTRQLAPGALSPTAVPLGLLPFDFVSRQPYGTLELLAEHFSGGTRDYLRDTATGAAQLFAQGDLAAEWQPAGRFLYYSTADTTYVYDTLTQQQAHLGKLPGGIWSPDGHLRADWISVPADQINQALTQGKLPSRLQVWNSDSGLLYTYCLPELNASDPTGANIVWSPDSRYLAFTLTLPVGGDVAPTPTFAISPAAPPASSTPIPLETQYEYQSPRTIVLDTATGSTTVISTEASVIHSWMGD